MMTVQGHGWDDNTGYPAFRNVITNGAMKVAQYGTSFSYASGGGARSYPADRFNVENYIWSAGSNPTVSNDTTVYPTGGFRNSIKYQVGATGLTFSSGGWQSIMHRVEGHNIAHLYSSTVTLSFWVRSSVTGTYGVGFYNDYWGIGSPTRGYVAEYTIIAANTWEKKTITTSLATATASGTWNSTNGLGLFLEWGLGSHADRKSSTYTGGWTPFSTYGVQSNNQVQLASTANATFYLAGVQLEAGPVATPFEFEPFETTLRKCHRYYYKMIGNAVGLYANMANGFTRSTTDSLHQIKLSVEMRQMPTLDGWTALRCYDSTNAPAVSSLVIDTQFSSPYIVSVISQSAGVVAARPAMLQGNNNAAAFIALTAEL